VSIVKGPVSNETGPLPPTTSATTNAAPRTLPGSNTTSASAACASPETSTNARAAGAREPACVAYCAVMLIRSKARVPLKILRGGGGQRVALDHQSRIADLDEV
jgi:hypothetical protein